MTRTLRVKDWNRFQHYKHRRPPWIRLYHDVLDDYDFQSLPVASRALLPMLWLLASESVDGSIPFDPTRLAFRLHLPPADFSAAVKPLIDGGFLAACGDASNALATCGQDATTEYRVQSTETETIPLEKKVLPCSLEENHHARVSRDEPLGIPSDSPESRAPEGLSELEYAKGLLEELGLSQMGNIMFVADAIKADAKKHGLTLAKAYDYVRAKALVDQREGVSINRFYFTDAKFRAGPNDQMSRADRAAQDFLRRHSA